MHYIDETIYTVKIAQKLQIQTKHNNGTISTEYKTIDLKPRKCTFNDFTIDNKYFK